MGFRQTFVNVKTVKNLDDVSLSEEKKSCNSGFEQDYHEVFEVLNVQYDGSQLDIINPLVQQIIKMDEDQVEKLVNDIQLHCSSKDEKNLDEYIELDQAVSKNENKKEAILGYIKAGTVSVSFATSLLTLVKSILGFVI